MSEVHPLMRSDALRNAVYKNRSATRALRHNITRGCIPCAMLPAVAPWIAPWDAVTPDAALKDLKALELVFKERLDDPNTLVTQEDTRKTAVEQIKEVTGSMTKIIDRARRRDPSNESLPFSKVQSLTVSLPNSDGSDALLRPHELRLLFAHLPGLQSLIVSNPMRNGAAWWTPQTDHRDDLPVTLTIPLQFPTVQEVADFLERIPRLTALDIRGSGSSFTPSELEKSLLLSRGTLRRIAAKYDYVPYILNESKYPKDPVAKAPVEISRTTAEDLADCQTIDRIRPFVPVSAFRFVPHMDTLESVVLTDVEFNHYSVPMLSNFVKQCPRLTSLRLCATRSSRNTLRHCLLKKRPEVSLALAHATVNEIVAAVTEGNPHLLTGLSADHLETLRAMASSGEYPNCLRFVLSRGVALTSLRSVCIDGALSDDMAAEVAAALAAVRCLRRAPARPN